MKKTFALLLVLCMVLSLAACGGSQPASSTTAPAASGGSTAAESGGSAGEPTNLVVWLPPNSAIDDNLLDETFWQENLADWLAEHNCTMDLTIIPWDSYEEKYLTAFSSGTGPDVGYMYNEMMYEYIDLGLIEPLDSYLTEADKDEYIFLDLAKINDQYYSIPFFPSSARVIFYHKDMLEAAGAKVPTTWAEFVDALQKIKENCPDVIPFAQHWNSEAIGLLNANYYPFLWSAGGELMDADGTVRLMDNDAAVKAAQFLYDLMYTYKVLPEECVGWTEADMTQMFLDREVAFIFRNCDFYDIWPKDDETIDFIPGLGETNGDDWITWIASDSLIMNAASEHKDLAWELIHYITGPEFMQLVHGKLCGGPPLTKSEPTLLSDRLTELYEQSDHFHAMPVAKNGAAVMSNLKSNLQLMLLGDLTPEEAIQNTVDYAAALG